MLAYRRQRGLHQRSPQLSEPSRGRRGGGRRTWRAAARLHGGHTHGRRAGRLKGVIGPTAAGLFSNSAPSASQAVRATYVDEIDSDDSDDDEREWSLRHAGVRRHQGARQGQAGRGPLRIGEGRARRTGTSSPPS